MQDLRKLAIPDWLRLMFNHRNTEEIARLSGWFHKNRMLPAAITRRGMSGDVPRIIEVVSWTWDDLAEIVAARLENVGGSIGVITYERVDVEAIYTAIRNAAPNKRVDCYHYGKSKGAENFSIREDGITVISSESAIGLEFDTVFLLDLSRSLPCTSDLDNRRLYMLTARARDRLSLVNGPGKLKQAQLDGLPMHPLLVR